VLVVGSQPRQGRTRESELRGWVLLGIHSGFYPWGSVGFIKRSAQRVRNVRN
jgi:hypothetical protein